MQIFASHSRRALLAGMIALCAGTAAGQDSRSCAVVLMHGQGGGPQALVAFGRKLQPACAARVPEMPWSAKRGGDKRGEAALQEIAAHVKSLRQQGHQRIVLAGQGMGANAAIAYAGSVGDVDAVVAFGPDATPAAAGWGELPALAPRVRQHIPLLWVVGQADPAHKLGEDHAFAKAPPHPSSRYVVVKANHEGTPEAALKVVLDWIKDAP